jgi:hypothetical protein
MVDAADSGRRPGLPAAPSAGEHQVLPGRPLDHRTGHATPLLGLQDNDHGLELILHRVQSYAAAGHLEQALAVAEVMALAQGRGSRRVADQIGLLHRLGNAHLCSPEAKIWRGDQRMTQLHKRLSSGHVIDVAIADVDWRCDVKKSCVSSLYGLLSHRGISP